MEYEYSFKVKEIDPYIEYCKNNGYEFIEETNQSRTLYRNTNKTLARITIKEKNNIIKKLLDFKDDNITDDILIERRESKSIEFTDDDAVESILNFLNYKKDNTLIRKRYVKESAKSIYQDYKDRVSFQTLQQILWGRYYSHLPIYKKKEKQWINNGPVSTIP